MSLTTLTVGGCLSVSDDPYECQPVELSKDRPANDPNFEILKEAHIRSSFRNGIDCEAEALFASPILHLTPGYPTSAECIMIDGAAEKPYPFQSVVRIDFAEKGLKFFWYDGGACPVSPKPVFPSRDLSFLSRDERLQIATIIELIKKARQMPGRIVRL